MAKGNNSLSISSFHIKILNNSEINKKVENKNNQRFLAKMILRRKNYQIFLPFKNNKARNKLNIYHFPLINRFSHQVLARSKCKRYRIRDLWRNKAVILHFHQETNHFKMYFKVSYNFLLHQESKCNLPQNS